MFLLAKLWFISYMFFFFVFYNSLLSFDNLYYFKSFLYHAKKGILLKILIWSYSLLLSIRYNTWFGDTCKAVLCMGSIELYSISLEKEEKIERSARAAWNWPQMRRGWKATDPLPIFIFNLNEIRWLHFY